MVIFGENPFSYKEERKKEHWTSSLGLNGGFVGLFSANQHSTFSTNVLTTCLLYYRVAALAKVRCRCYWLLLKYLLLFLFHLLFFLLWSILIMYVSFFFPFFPLNIYCCTVPRLGKSNRHITKPYPGSTHVVESENVFHFSNISNRTLDHKNSQHPQTVYKTILLRMYMDSQGRKV